MIRGVSLRERWLLVLAVGVAGLTLWSMTQDAEKDEVVESVRVAAPVRDGKLEVKRPDEVSAADIDVGQLRRGKVTREPGNAFASRSWYVPPPPPPPPPKVEPPPPTAPPLPFVYLGRYVDAGVPTFFLARGDRVLTVRAGDVLDGIYRIDGVEGQTMSLTYMPLNIRQTLDVGSAV